MGWFSGQVVERGNKSKVSFFPWKKEKGAKSETKYKRRAKRERAKGCPGGEKSQHSVKKKGESRKQEWKVGAFFYTREC